MHHVKTVIAAIGIASLAMTSGCAACGAARPNGKAGTVVRDATLLIEDNKSEGTVLRASGCIRLFLDAPAPQFVELEATAFFFDNAGRILGHVHTPPTTVAVPMVVTGAQQSILQDPLSASILFNEGDSYPIGHLIAHGAVKPQILFEVVATPFASAGNPDESKVTVTNFMADACVVDDAGIAHPVGACPDLPGGTLTRKPMPRAVKAP
jgi:hypothetical protein